MGCTNQSLICYRLPIQSIDLFGKVIDILSWMPYPYWSVDAGEMLSAMSRPSNVLRMWMWFVGKLVKKVGLNGEIHRRPVPLPRNKTSSYGGHNRDTSEEQEPAYVPWSGPQTSHAVNASCEFYLFVSSTLCTTLSIRRAIVLSRK